MIRAAEALFKPFNRGATLAPLFLSKMAFRTPLHHDSSTHKIH